MAGFEITHISRMCNLQLHKAIAIPPSPDKDGKINPNRKPKVQLLFFGRCIKRNSDRVINEYESKSMHSLLGDSILARFKLDETIFIELFRLGLTENSYSDWDVIPQLWNIDSKAGVWFAPATLLKLNGKDINFPIIRVPEDNRENAFEKYSKRDLGALENQINSELEAA